MKKITEGSIWKKIITAFLVFLLLFQFMMPAKSYAWELGDLGQTISDAIWEPFKEKMGEIASGMVLGMARIAAWLGDVAEGALNNFMLGTEGFGSAMISHEALDQDNGSWFIAESGVGKGQDPASQEKQVDIKKEGDNTVVYVKRESLDDSEETYINEDHAMGSLFSSGKWEIPNILYSPENIFGNNIAMLDVNFLNPNTYEAVNDTEEAKESQTSIGSYLHSTIQSWYLAFRNIAIVSMLSILVYLGIRILISSTAEDKAKYKQLVRDWAIALCLIFVMHFIMSGIIMIINRVNQLFVEMNNNVYINYGGTVFKTNFIGVMRFLAQSTVTADAWIYTLIYWVLIFYTITFTFQYLKRVLYIAFYTMISPLVAITYPMDKLGDGRSQAFNKWFKEYIMTMALQPIHLVLYTVLITSSITLALNQPIYALVAIGFLVEAEKFIKSLFGIQSQADGGFGSFASGALAMKAIDTFAKGGKSNNGGNGRDSSQDKEKSEEKNKIRQQKHDTLEAFRDKPEGNEDSTYIAQGDRAQLGQEQNEEQQALNDEFDKEVANIYGASYLASMDGSQNASETLQSGDSGDSVRFNDQSQYGGIEMPIVGDSAQGTGSPEISDTSTRQENNEARTAANTPTATQQNATARSTNGAGKDELAQARYNRMRRQRTFAKAKSIGGAGIKKAIRGVKKGSRMAFKATGAGVFGTIGLAAGLAGGNGIEGAAKMAIGGAYAGSAIGNRAANMAERVADAPYNAVQGVRNGVRKVGSAVEEYRDNKIEDMRNAGLTADANKLESERARKDKRFDQMIKDYALHSGRKIKKDEYEDYRNKIYDYQVKRGITDQDKIFKGLDLEEKYKDQYSHEQIADVMELTNSFGKEYVTDGKKREQFDRELKSDGVTGQNKEKVGTLFYEANGVDPMQYYEDTGIKPTLGMYTNQRQTKPEATHNQPTSNNSNQTLNQQNTGNTAQQQKPKTKRGRKKASSQNNSTPNRQPRQTNQQPNNSTDDE